VSVFNRRNAVIGWIAWSAGKRAAKYAAKDAAKGVAPSIHPKTKKPNKSAIVLGVMAVIGALAFWRKRSGSTDDAPLEVDDAPPAVPDAAPPVSDTAGV
jgi:hypothetical protein